MDRDISKNGVDEGALKRFLAENYSSYIIDDRGDHWHIRVNREDLDEQLKQLQAFNFTHLLWDATIIEIGAGDRPVKVRRGEHEVWCYVTTLVKKSAASYKVGDTVLVGFIRGNRSMPVVMG